MWLSTHRITGTELQARPRGQDLADRSREDRLPTEAFHLPHRLGLDYDDLDKDAAVPIRPITVTDIELRGAPPR
ncbi:hypothetical protein [Nocardia sp. NPDC004604]|uniref:hypothetical protein n=1 Tax=Nocardia sp. NPDC004604 TaxID=3157013 RepID=UPI0033B103E4